jgi:hypothetical protein
LYEEREYNKDNLYPVEHIIGVDVITYVGLSVTEVILIGEEVP